jgi:hypothetical protein
MHREFSSGFRTVTYIVVLIIKSLIGSTASCLKKILPPKVLSPRQSGGVPSALENLRLL